MDVLDLLSKPSECFFLSFAVFFKLLLPIGVVGEDEFEGGRRETTTWFHLLTNSTGCSF